MRLHLILSYSLVRQTTFKVGLRRKKWTSIQAALMSFLVGWFSKAIGERPPSLSSFGAPAEVVIEACRNWGALYDLLEGMDGVAKVVLSHPAKNRIIADANQERPR